MMALLTFFSLMSHYLFYIKNCPVLFLSRSVLFLSRPVPFRSVPFCSVLFCSVLLFLKYGR